MVGTEFAIGTVASDLKKVLILEFLEIEVHERVHQAIQSLFCEEAVSA
jgi:hypothetical protein